MKIDTQLLFKTIPKDKESSDLLKSKAWQEMVEFGGRVCQIIGMPRSTGQIFGLLYLSAEPLSLNQVSSMLSISKGSASTGTRQLASWGTIRKVWVPGDRRDYYEVIEDLGQIISVTYNNLIKPKILSSKDRLTKLKRNLNEEIKSGSIPINKAEVLSKRIQNLENINNNIIRLLPLTDRIVD